MKFFPGVRSIISGLTLACLLGGSLLGCRTVQTCGSSLQSYKDQPGLWNSIKRMSNRALLQRWVNRFLASLLHNGRYQLESQGSTFIVIDPKDSHESRCKMKTQTHQALLKDPEFLQRLHAIVTSHKLNIRDYLYRAPSTTVIQGRDTQVWGGNCNLKRFRVEASYWKAISTKYTRDRWAEACRIGRALKRWKECFTPPFTKMYKERMKRVCGQ